MRVFVAEDSATLRERLMEMISEIQGIEPVGSAADAASAISLIREMHPDVVLLDIQLQQSSGYQVLKDIKSRDDDSITIIVFTNFAYPQYQRKYMEAGADYFFDKSTQFDEVTKVLERLSSADRAN